jgi:protein-disulfide isomerase
MKLKGLIFGAISLSALAYNSVDSVQNQNNLSANQKQQVVNIVLETIKQNPQVLIQQIEKYQLEKIRNVQLRDQRLVLDNKSEIFMENNKLSYGSPRASKVIVEFIDYSCKHCKTLARNINKLYETNRDFRVIVKELPVLGKNSENAAKAAIAASKQNKFMKYHNYLLTTNDSYTLKNLNREARRLKLNMKKFRADLKSANTRKYLEKNQSLAKKLHINATPTIIVSNSAGTNSKIIPGLLSQSQVSQLVNSLNSNNLL